jgi:hypothetical protein
MNRIRLVLFDMNSRIFGSYFAVMNTILTSVMALFSAPPAPGFVARLRGSVLPSASESEAVRECFWPLIWPKTGGPALRTCIRDTVNSLLHDVNILEGGAQFPRFG